MKIFSNNKAMDMKEFEREIDTVEISDFCKKVNEFYYFTDPAQHYAKVPLIEKALKETRKALVESLLRKTQGTHIHKKNMVYTYGQLLEMLSGAIGDYGHSFGPSIKHVIKRIYLTHYQRTEDYFHNIEEIIQTEGFTHREQGILVRPYIHDFALLSDVGYGQNFLDIHNKVSDMLIEKLKSFTNTKTNLERLSMELSRKTKNLFFDCIEKDKIETNYGNKVCPEYNPDGNESQKENPCASCINYKRGAMKQKRGAMKQGDKRQW